jgi:hypothetical protein
MFTNAVGNPNDAILGLTLAGGLQGVYIVGGNDPYRGGLSPPAPPTGVPVGHGVGQLQTPLHSATGLAPLVRSWPLLYRIWITI